MSVALHESTADEKSVSRRSTEAGPSPILVVDDSLVSRRLAGSLIERGTGLPVAYAENGREALAFLATREALAVVTDLQMPEIDGLALVETIRARHPRTPIILMTAYGSENIALSALKAGAANYVPKKSLARDLVATLEQVFALAEGNQKRRRLLACQSCRMARYEIENDPSLLASLVSVIQEDLIVFEIGDETARMRVGVALQESLANALFHGNLECSSDLRQEDERIFYRLAEQRRALDPYRSRRILVESYVDRDLARIVIQDEGPGFDIAGLDKPFDPDDLMRVGGRGMVLIRTFMDEVIHNATGNRITLIKRR